MGKDIKLNSTYHDFLFVPDIKNICVKATTLAGNNIQTFKSTSQAKEWLSDVYKMDKYIKDFLEELKLEHQNPKLVLSVSLEPFNHTRYRAKLEKKHIKSEKSIDHLFQLIQKRLVNYTADKK